MAASLASLIADEALGIPWITLPTCKLNTAQHIEIGGESKELMGEIVIESP